MAIFAGADTGNGLAGQTVDRAYDANLSASLGIPTVWTTEQLLTLPDLNTTVGGSVVKRSETAALHTPVHFDGFEQPSMQELFFGQILILPDSIALGTILTAQQITLDVYSSYLTGDHTFENFVNNAGAGISISDLPTFPFTMGPQSGFQLTVDVSLDGPPVINGTLDFVFDTGTISIPITGVRTIVFPFIPERPITERLRFQTDVLAHRDGTEQRVRLRHTPRQHFDFSVRLDGEERRRMEALLFDSQSRGIGLPIRTESTALTTAAASSDTTIFVESTAYSDFRVGGLATIFADSNTLETLEIDSFDSTSITFTSALSLSFAAGVRVMPTRLGFLIESLKGLKYPRSVQELSFTFTVVDNSVDLSDTSAFDTYNSKVLLDGPNMIDPSGLKETYQKQVTVIDSNTGTFRVFSEWDTNRRSSVKTFFSTTRQQLWEIRQLLHSLGGRYQSFYLPTFYPELDPDAAVTSGSSVLNIVHQRYTDFVQSRQPRDVIRLVLTDGTTVVRQVLTSSELDSDTEQLTVDSAWGVDALVSEIEYIDYVEEVRFDTDEITIIHTDGLGQATIKIPVIAVFE
jgi:hypothetical protein